MFTVPCFPVLSRADAYKTHFLWLANAYNSHTKGINMVCSWTMQHLDLNNEALSWYLS